MGMRMIYSNQDPHGGTPVGEFFSQMKEFFENSFYQFLLGQ
jgi:hypothetical protein